MPKVAPILSNRHSAPRKPGVSIMPFVHPELWQLVMLRLNRHNACLLGRYYRAREQALLSGSSEPLRPFRRVTVRDTKLADWALDCDLDSMLAASESLTHEEQRQLDRFLDGISHKECEEW